MATHSYEIEIKSLLGNKENADKLVGKMKEKDAGLQIIGSHKQLNHYFVPNGGNLKKIFNNVKDIIKSDKLDKLQDLAEKAKDFSVRTRWADGKVILVIKASVDDTTSFNGTARLEWEGLINLQLDELDKLILDSGFQYQAKWSREREEFVFHPTVGAGFSRPQTAINVSIDKNAGYGHLAEFEMVINDQSAAEETKAFIRSVMKNLEIEELLQDRLARMFDYYNNNWRDYYGTDKIFVIE
ncbi:MAG: hypothetical protein M1383_03890 [Patescibacteria group bacterium]|nr:hypothetical protein [Patescibacteria group bacterium]